MAGFGGPGGPGGVLLSQDQGIPDAEVMRSSFREALGNILRFMDAVANTETQNPQNFRAVWGSIGSPSTITDTANAIRRIMSVSNVHVISVLQRIDPEYRKYLHTQILDLSEKTKGEMPEMGQAAIMLQWLMGTLLPDMQQAGLPEDAVLGTTHILKKNYGAITETCAVARPDTSNPTCQALNAKTQQALAKLQETERAVAESQRIVQEAQALALERQRRLEKFGFAVVAEAAEDAAAVKALARRETKKQISTLTALSVTGFVLFAVLLIALIVVVAVQATKRGKQGGAFLGMAGAGAGAGSGAGANTGSAINLGYGGIPNPVSTSSFVGRPFIGGLGGHSGMPSFDLSREWT